MTFTDHLTVPDGCSEVDSSKAALTVADQASRLNALGDLRDVLEALGLVGPTAPVSLGVRDAIGRLRTVSAPATAIPDPAPVTKGVPVGHHGHNGRCASGDHPWIPENIRRNETTGRLRCRACEQRRKRGPAKPKDPNAPVLCRCPGRKHELTPYSSESTYVDPRGQRLCRVGIDRRRQAERLLPAEQRTLLPGEKLCRCRPERHVLTPYNSDTTYVDADGHMRCRAVRRVRKPNTEAAA